MSQTNDLAYSDELIGPIPTQPGQYALEYPTKPEEELERVQNAKYASYEHPLYLPHRHEHPPQREHTIQKEFNRAYCTASTKEEEDMAEWYYCTIGLDQFFLIPTDQFDPMNGDQDHSGNIKADTYLSFQQFKLLHDLRQQFSNLDSLRRTLQESWALLLMECDKKHRQMNGEKEEQESVKMRHPLLDNQEHQKPIKLEIIISQNQQILEREPIPRPQQPTPEQQEKEKKSFEDQPEPHMLLQRIFLQWSKGELSQLPKDPAKPFYYRSDLSTQLPRSESKDINAITGRTLLRDLLPFGHTRTNVFPILEQPEPLDHHQLETARNSVSPVVPTNTSKPFVPINMNVKLVEKKHLNTSQTMTNASSTNYTPTALRAYVLSITTTTKTTGDPTLTIGTNMETMTTTETESRRLQIKNRGNSAILVRFILSNNSKFLSGGVGCESKVLYITDHEKYCKVLITTWDYLATQSLFEYLDGMLFPNAATSPPSLSEPIPASQQNTNDSDEKEAIMQGLAEINLRAHEFDFNSPDTEDNEEPQQNRGQSCPVSAVRFEPAPDSDLNIDPSSGPTISSSSSMYISACQLANHPLPSSNISGAQISLTHTNTLTINLDANARVSPVTGGSSTVDAPLEPQGANRRRTTRLAATNAVATTITSDNQVQGPGEAIAERHIVVYTIRAGLECVEYVNKACGEEAIDQLWKDPIIPKIMGEHSSKFYLMDLAGYFFSEILWIGQPNQLLYVHCLSSVLVTLIRAVEYTWSTSALGALSKYSQVLREERSQNWMAESLILFESVINLRWFLYTSIILFLNKIDVFTDKPPKLPLEHYFPKYTGGADIKKAAKYILWRFRQANRAKLNVYPHLMQAMDTESV
ncbi:G-alpha-domain-containing protein [Coprinopsis marcescibilis]|uniref:G-alpha-domain-containing protein n=1 Tax=Coprinopsis marcescibilis TaxID=230819 RepID=A0A5C3L592_COPMA|nr:G-alpha-domain-containing protein [Coprinopsis marcescibilis]